MAVEPGAARAFSNSSPLDVGPASRAVAGEPCDRLVPVLAEGMAGPCSWGVPVGGCGCPGS